MTLLWPLLFFACLGATVAAWLWGPPLATQWRRRRVRRQPFPAAWRDILRRRMPAFAQLPTDLQLQLKKHVQVLVAEKPFVGCAGLEIDDEIRVLIAAQAALLLLNRRGAEFGPDFCHYFPLLRQVLVYPGAFVVERSQADDTGLTHDSRRALAGESWQQGQLLLSWDDVVAGAADPADGRNVVIHEFAHQLDQQHGGANGAPWLGRRAWQVRWAAVMAAEFDALRLRLSRGEPGLIDAYAASVPAEFYAVVSEHFFEQPQALAAGHPALYRELARCYRTDPLNW